jgi:hypothetical protein
MAMLDCVQPKGAALQFSSGRQIMLTTLGVGQQEEEPGCTAQTPV